MVAAVDKKFDHLLVRLDGLDHLRLVQRPALIDVDHVEDLAGRGQKFRAESLVLGLRRALAALAFVR